VKNSKDFPESSAGIETTSSCGTADAGGDIQATAP
jgi:hypothetical protein